MADKTSFVMHFMWGDIFENLPKEKAGELIQAIYRYQRTGSVAIGDPVLSAVFEMIKVKMDEDGEKYRKKVRANQENGRKGGRPKTQNNPVGFFETQMNPQKPDTDTDTVIDAEYVSERDIVSNSDELDMSAEPTANNSYKVPYQEIVKAYHETCVSLPGIRSVSDARRKLMRSRYHEHGLDAIKIVFDKAEASDFLTGRKEPYWNGCGFDWLMKPSNFLKVLEGNYDNKKNRSSPNSNNPFLDMLKEEMRGDGS